MRLILIFLALFVGSTDSGLWADEPVSAYAPSTVISRIDWAPSHTIVRQAKDGDNWPVTWADDDALYTTWGDGTGFPPRIERKLSCGFARVTGSPTDFRGVKRIPVVQPS